MISKDFWGQSLHLDLRECNTNKFSKKHLKKFCNILCQKIEMEPYGDAIVERFGEGKIEGHSALQFIKTSSISIHTDIYFKRVFIDIFSCKQFDRYGAKSVSKAFFQRKRLILR